MENRKIYCEVVEGIVYDDRCLFKLSKVIENNKSCENCILHEVEKTKSCEVKKIDPNIGKRKRGSPRRSQRAEKKISSTGPPRILEEEAEEIKDASKISKQMYSTQDLISLLKKSERTIREWAQEGKIPGHKVGKKWCFSKEEIDRWLSERKGETKGTQEIEDQQEAATSSTQSPGDLGLDNNQESSNLPIGARIPGDLDHEENE